MRSLVTIVLVAMLTTFAAAQGGGSMCLQSPPGLPSGNGLSGTMFDIQATAAVVIQDFRQAGFTAGQVITYEVYAITAGGTYVGSETNAAAWTLLATTGPITMTGPGTADSLGLNLGFVVPGGATQGFYVTGTSGTVSYTNGIGTPGVTIVASDPLISVTEGVGNAYPFGAGFFAPRNNNMEVCYDPGMGLFANFNGTPTSGPGPLTVAFTDASFTSDPAGIQTWGWDFGDGNTSTLQNPSHTYTCPGAYDVTLTVTDTLNPQSTITKTGYITVSAPTFSMSTTGGGTGDLVINPVDTSCFPAATSGYTLVTLSGPGPLFGITPDVFTFSLVVTPPSPGWIPHFIVTPGTYPNGGATLFPAGFFTPLTGQTLTAVEVLLDINRDLLFVSNADSVTF